MGRRAGRFDGWILAVCLAMTLVGCRGKQPEQGLPSGPPAAGGPGSRPGPGANQPVIQASRARVMGLAVPEGLEPLSREPDLVQFVTPADLEALVRFFSRSLADHTVERRVDGVRFSAAERGSPDVYVVERGDHREVDYVRDVPLPSLPATHTGEGGSAAGQAGASGQAAEAVPFARRYPWPQGPVASPEVVQALTQDRQPGASGHAAGAIYDEHVEQIDGQSVRVLTLRPQSPAPTAPASAGSAELPTQNGSPRLTRVPGGGYDRGDGQRSLRATPALDDQGHPLPFLGPQPVSGDHSREPQ